ncbi:MAG TPA: hypothetical protein VEY51_05505, partial [Chondromyces sp.]|nr:hypothetical protein [Chondromyces sp.]
MLFIISILFGFLGVCAAFNFLYSLLFIVSYSGVNRIYRWFFKEAEFLEFITFPLLGPAYYTAGGIYQRFNGLLARLLVIGFA